MAATSPSYKHRCKYSPSSARTVHMTLRSTLGDSSVASSHLLKLFGQLSSALQEREVLINS